MYRHNCPVVFAAAVALSILGGMCLHGAYGEIIFDGYNVPQSWDASGSVDASWNYDPDFPGDTMGTRYAVGFTTPTNVVDWALESVVMAAYKQASIGGVPTNTDGIVKLSIVKDNGGLPTGPVVWSRTDIPEITTDLGNRTISVAGILGQGQSYWLKVEPIEVQTNQTYDAQLRWHLPDPAPSSSVTRAWSAYMDGGWDNWQAAAGNAAAFQILGRPVQFVVITSFQGNGILEWTNTIPDAKYLIQWSSSLSEGFSSDWARFSTIQGTSTHMSVKIPMFYRVVSY